MRHAVLAFVCGSSLLASGCGAAEAAEDRPSTGDRAMKVDVQDIDAAQVLAKVVDLQVTSWRYRIDSPKIRHLGPMAQDFFASFGLANSEQVIHPLDLGGVSLAAIQALHSRVVAAETENQQLRARMDTLEQRLAALETP